MNIALTKYYYVWGEPGIIQNFIPPSLRDSIKIIGSKTREQIEHFLTDPNLFLLDDNNEEVALSNFNFDFEEIPYRERETNPSLAPLYSLRVTEIEPEAAAPAPLPVPTPSTRPLLGFPPLPGLSQSPVLFPQMVEQDGPDPFSDEIPNPRHPLLPHGIGATP